MTQLDHEEYIRFASKFIKIFEDRSEVAALMGDYMEDEMPIPKELLLEAKKIDSRVRYYSIMAQTRYGKKPMEVINDGWKIWEEEDRILREERYGGQK